MNIGDGNVEVASCFFCLFVFLYYFALYLSREDFFEDKKKRKNANIIMTICR